MRTLQSGWTALITIGFLALGCDSKSTEPEPPQGGGPILQPNPDGVLLPGDGAGAATAALSLLPPSAVDVTDISDGFITTRLDAWVAFGATVADVNAALTAATARIVTMSDGSPMVTLKIPPVSDRAEADALAESLVSTGAFTYATPCAVVDVPSPLRDAAAARGGLAPAHLDASRFIAAWNVRELALTNDADIPVLVPDEYASTLQSNEIDAQSFVGFGAANSLPGPDVYPGNNGFVVSGIIGANVDETAPTGTNPSPVDLLDIRSMALGGLTWNDLFWSLAYQVATNGNRFVLNTGIGYNDPDYETFDRVERAFHVIAWRVAAAPHYAKFLHVTSAGSPEGDVELNSPFVAATRFGDVRDMVDLSALDPADSLSLETAWADLNANYPPATTAATNVLVVGAKDYAGAVLSSSAAGDVYAIGAGVVGPCEQADPAGGVLCDGSAAAYSGTSVAAAQVSGLAAYLMNLGTHSPAAIRNVIVQSSDNGLAGVIDAFDAVLSLDGSDVGPVRRTLLDVAGFESSESDGDFDDYDLPDLINVAPRVGGGQPSLFPPRLDLNGDDVAGGLGTARFDLNGDGAYGNVSQPYDGGTLEFDEHAVTDFDIVCYYAFSDLYNGDPDVRAELLVPAHSGVFVSVTGLPDRSEVGVPYTVTVTAGLLTDSGSEPLEGVSISLELDGGSAIDTGGTTGPGGTFQTDVMLNEDSNDLVVRAWGEFATGEEVSGVQSALRIDEVTIESRDMWVGGETFAVYSSEPGVPSVTFIEETDFETILDFTTVDETYGTTGSGTAAGMQVSGSSSADVLCNLDLATGDRFFGASLTSSCSSDITLTNPNTSLNGYQASSDSWVEVEIGFSVWGEPALFNMHGTTNGQYYDIELAGGSDLFVCNTDDEPCSTISTGGELTPGYYSLSLDISSFAYISSSSDTPAQGTVSESSDLHLTFEVNHNGLSSMTAR